MEKVIVQPGQSLFDIAFQTLGNVEDGLEKIALHNGKEYTDGLTPGEELEYDLAWVSDLRIVNFFKRNNIPATATLNPNPEVVLEGVGYDLVEDTLIVYE